MIKTETIKVTGGFIMKGKKSLLKKIGEAAAGIFLSAVMALYLPVMALAWNIEDGDITVNKTSESQTVSQGDQQNVPDDNPTITGTSDTYTVTISAAQDTTATVTFRDLNINTRENPSDSNSDGAAAVSVNGAGNVNIELVGSNSLTSGYNHAGIEDRNSGTLTIHSDNNGTLYAIGGYNGAGIGGGTYGDGSNITISGNATVTATGGRYAAGIGGGDSGDGSNITITDTANVTATSIKCGAGIGGGTHGDGSGITISGNATVTATGGEDGAGIGGGTYGDGSNINIDGNSTVIAVGAYCGAGIGGGNDGNGSAISVAGNADVYAAGSANVPGYGDGAAIGGGGNDYGEDGAEVDVDTSGLTGGSVNRFDPGTTVEQIQNGIPDLNPQARPAAVVPSDSEAVSGENAQTAPASEAFSLSAVLDAKVETFLQQLAALLASGRPDLIRALMKAGFSVDLGDFTMLNAKTCALLAQVADAGIPVKADYTYGGVNYRVMIPAGEGASVNALASDGVCTVEELMSAFETQTR